jgi:hypothetical protein
VGTVVMSQIGLVVDALTRVSHEPPAATQTGLYDELVLYLVMQQPLVQRLPGQHGPPGLPQTWHRELLQIVPGSLQV